MATNRASAEISEIVDFDAPDGFLWQPMSLSKLECTPHEEHCAAVVQFCLINMASYQANPWKYPMAVMMQKMSRCHTSGNNRSFRLSALRVGQCLVSCAT